MAGTLVTAATRPPRALLGHGLAAQRWALRTAAGVASDAVLRGVEALLASRLAEEAIARAVDSPAMEQLVERVLDSHLMESATARLLESEELWLLVAEVAQSPAVAEAIARQGVGFADEVAEEVRERSEHADAWLERAARRMLRRGARAGPRPQMPAEPGTA